MLLFHIMAYFYMIYRYVFSKWRSIRPVEINQYDITVATHYDITMSNDIAMCIYYGLTMHNDIAINLFYYVVSALCLIMILLGVVWNKNTKKLMFDQSGLEKTFIIFL